MASASSSSSPDNEVETHCRRRTKRARIDDGSRPAEEPTIPAPSGHSSWRDWASLACGPATVIADRVLAADITNYIRFRAVCGAWRRCTADPHGGDALDRRFHPHHWTMLCKHEWIGDRRYFWFQHMSTGEIVVRGIDGRTLLGRTWGGLLVLLNRDTDAACVVNPITGAHADLPPVNTLLAGHRRRDLDFQRFPDGAHFSAELTDGSAPVVVVSFRGHRWLGVARPGDERWAVVERGRQIHGLFSSVGRVYCCSGKGKTIMVLKTSPDQPPRLVKAFT